MSDEMQNPQAEQPVPAMMSTEEVSAKCEEYLSGWKRAQADYANLKREVERERSEFSKFANERLLSSLLPAVDHFETALDFVPDTSTLPDMERKRIDNWLVGIKAVRGLWQNAFGEIGLEHVPVKGPFDPALHEAVGQESAPDLADGDIIRCMQSGWRLNGKLLRPAKVIVADNSQA